MQKTSSLAIAAALAVFTAQAAIAQDQNATTTGQQPTPPAATTPAPDTGMSGTGDTSAQTTPPAADADTSGTAQTTPPAGTDTDTSGTAQTTPPAGTDADTSGTAQTTTPATPDTSATASASTDKPNFIQAQSADQFLGSDLMGSKVISAANEDIGEVNDVLFGMDGRGEAVVIGVGGFLGIGEKNVAVPFERLTINREADDADDFQVSLDTTKDELNAAPEFRDMDDQRTATSSTEGVTPTPNATGSTTPAPAPAPEPTKP